MSNTSFAVLTKARSKFGRRLKDKDYTNLLACQNVTEVMSYLKSNTHYSSALRDVNERDVHRGRLETILKQNLFYEFDSMCRYDSSVSSGFSQYIIERVEIEQIIKFLVLLSSNETDKFIFQFPAYFTKHTTIDIDQLSNTKTYSEFLNVLSNSCFYPILKDYSPDSKGRLPISEIENKLNDYIFSQISQSINAHTKGEEKKELVSLFTTINDYDNFSRILRLKKYYDLSCDVVKENLVSSFCDINKKTLDAMCKAESSAEIFSIMQSTNEGRLIDKIGYVYASDISPRVKYRLARKNMYFSNNPSVVLISYMFVTEIELMNIITLIEGTRYNLDSKKIQSLLIY